MSNFGKIEEKLKAQDLRKLGFSYSEILKRVRVSKDTLSRWCRDIALNQKQKRRLMAKKSLGQKKGSLVAADNRRLERIIIGEKINRLAKKEVGRVLRRDRFMFGLALYLAEGDQSEGRVGFSSSNDQLIKFMQSWFVDFLKIKKVKLRGSIWLHDKKDVELAEEHWTSLLGLPSSQLGKTYVVKTRTKKKKLKIKKSRSRSLFGVFCLRFTSAGAKRKINGWTRAVLG